MGIAKGDKVKFVGFAEDEIPENGENLIEDEIYEVFKVSEEGDDTSYFLQVDNPEFDASKKATKKNPEFVYVNVFEDEVAAVEDDEEETEEEVEEDETEEETEEEEAPAPKAKKAPAKKAAAKKETTKAKPGRKAKAKTEEAAAPKKRGRPAKVKTEEEEGDPDLKGLTILERDEEDEDILAMVEDGDVLELAKELVAESTTTEYRLGGILYHVRVSKVYKELDPSYAEIGGLQLYIQEQLGMEYRKAMYLVDIYTKFSKAGIHGDRVGEIGWTKAKEIARVVNEENADALLEAASESTVNELKETIKESYSRDGKETRPVVKKTTFKFRLVAENGEAIEDYLLQAQEMLGHAKLDETFEHIVTEWATEHLNAKPAKAETKAEAKTTAKAKTRATPKAKARAKAA